MGLFYHTTKTAAAVVAGNDVMTFAAGATRSFRIVGVIASGEGTASAANEFAFFRTTTLGITGTVPIVPAPTNTAAGAFSGVVNTAWVTQPVVSTAGMARFGVNSNGGVLAKSFTDLEKIDVAGGAAAASSVSLRCVSGSGTIGFTVVIEEF
jgi:hypothetical protein